MPSSDFKFSLSEGHFLLEISCEAPSFETDEKGIYFWLGGRFLSLSWSLGAGPARPI